MGIKSLEKSIPAPQPLVLAVRFVVRHSPPEKTQTPTLTGAFFGGLVLFFILAMMG
jgi:hypothetical protein